ncbi:hypothetical protein BH10PLA2_BH10PLA2_13970 [soil metagenome]
MTKYLRTLLASSILFCIPACSGGGIDSRNKDLDRPKSVEEKAAAPANPKPAPPAPEKTPAQPNEKTAAPVKK